MTVDQIEIAQDASAAELPPEPCSADWWQARTALELRDIIKRGFGAGDIYGGAIVETERRAREATRRLRDEASAADRRTGKLRLTILSAGLAIIVATGLLQWFAR